MAEISALKMQLVSSATNLNDDADARAAVEECLAKLKQLTPAAHVSPDAGHSIEAFKEALKARGTHGIVTIGRKFKSMDDDGSGKLCYDEFKKACKEVKLAVSETDLMRLFRAFDSDASGYITFDELLQGLKGPLVPRRKDMVAMAFKILDKTGDGVVTMHDIQGRYDAKKHPDVIAGTKTAQQVLEEFLSVFDGRESKGTITYGEFEQYYSCVSASVDDDDYFELMIRNAWHISGGEGWCANTTCKRVLVVASDGSQKVVEIQNDLGLDVTNVNAVKAHLIKQGITDIKGIALYGDFVENAQNPATPPRTSLAGGPVARADGARRTASNVVFGQGDVDTAPRTLASHAKPPPAVAQVNDPVGRRANGALHSKSNITFG